ncbi:MAG: prolipoprotein diacylglyceryl transferase [Oscillospiraceae bacterium]|nr:prolipoprotein diacylglyceryl transferase [Oscillospiraceae bacterium]
MLAVIHWLSFPGLGIGPFKIDTVAFNIFGKDIAWYGIIICCGMILAFLYSNNRARHEGVSTDDFLDLIIFAIPVGIICARTYFVLTKLELYDSFWDMCKIWEGGLAIYGAIIGGFIVVLAFSKIKKIKFYKLLDIVAPGVLIGQIIGRWGNFANAEAHGGSTGLPWRMGIGSTNVITEFYHPTFLYESVWNLIGFLIIHLVYKKKKFDGQIFCLYIAWYGFGRMFIEMLRTDSLYINLFGTEYRISALVGLLSFIVGLILYITLKKGGLRHEEAVLSKENSFKQMIKESDEDQREVDSAREKANIMNLKTDNTDTAPSKEAAPDASAEASETSSEDEKTGRNS